MSPEGKDLKIGSCEGSKDWMIVGCLSAKRPRVLRVERWNAEPGVRVMGKYFVILEERSGDVAAGVVKGGRTFKTA